MHIVMPTHTMRPCPRFRSLLARKPPRLLALLPSHENRSATGLDSSSLCRTVQNLHPLLDKRKRGGRLTADTSTHAIDLQSTPLRDENWRWLVTGDHDCHCLLTRRGASRSNPPYLLIQCATITHLRATAVHHRSSRRQGGIERRSPILSGSVGSLPELSLTHRSRAIPFTFPHNFARSCSRNS